MLRTTQLLPPALPSPGESHWTNVPVSVKDGGRSPDPNTLGVNQLERGDDSL